MDKKELKKYLKNNLKLNFHYQGNNTLVIELNLEGENITKDFVHYKIKDNK